MKKRTLLIFTLVVTVASYAGYRSVFTLPDTAQVTTITPPTVSANDMQPELACYQNPAPQILDHDGQLNLLVWNIYKQNRSNWQQALEGLAQDKQLLLLQEASMTEELRAWIDAGQWSGNLVDAFKAFDTSAGVLNLAHQLPKRACGYTEMEPWLRLPKSALFATYALSNGQTLAVVNIHAVNFTYGTQEYHHQLEKLANVLKAHTGPVIVAGDFNSWSEQRLAVMKGVLAQVGVQEVDYQLDHRKQFINGLPLDHLFYRGLTLEKAEAPISDASDHNPIEVYFRLLPSVQSVLENQ
ncbi:endonuclease/exonuclease/phosphatase family protein [Vibrio sp. N418]|uniref:endonuclease/exonuclease/phosphatase family protein n=1 Tax=Vibrio sp. (strain N418) TaxID=701176 RepID=UPI000570733F|nr:endonuclease/exonuclease/phosphatase family protein [Vibrio sp. N418]